MAFEERSQSDDPRAKLVAQSGVGTIIVKDGHVLARSANIMPPRLKAVLARTGRAILDDERYHFIEHAERAAIFEALRRGERLEGATIYCSRFPCSDCARAIISAGITRAVFANGYGGEQRWIDAQRAASSMLRLSGVTVRVLRNDALT